MKTGETLTDDRGRAWTIGKALGLGTWSRTWLVRGDGGDEAVLKVAHGDAELMSLGIDGAVAQRVLEEQAALMQGERRPAWLPRLVGTVRSGERYAILVPRYTASLGQRIRDGVRVAEALGVVAHQVQILAESGTVHGNLHPDNVFPDAQGGVVLTDPVTPAAVAALAEVRSPWRPPEAGATLDPSWDPWALCGQLLQVARGDRPPAPLDKAEVASLKDRLVERLRDEGANPRFASRAVEKYAALLKRGLSDDAEPSPPYRFAHVRALAQRLSVVHDLLHPRIESLGKLFLSQKARDGVFEGGNPVEFSVSVGCLPEDMDKDDLVTGLRLVDLDDPDKRRVPLTDTRFTVKKHLSGRLRYNFVLPNVPPGRYDVEVAFAVRDSGHPPELAGGELEVRPPPGYVPPTDEPEPQAMDLASARAQRTPRPAADPPSQGGELIADMFPSPVAPSTIGATPSPPPRAKPRIPGGMAATPPPPSPLPLPSRPGGPSSASSPGLPPRPAGVKLGPVPVPTPSPIPAPRAQASLPTPTLADASMGGPDTTPGAGRVTLTVPSAGLRAEPTRPSDWSGPGSWEDELPDLDPPSSTPAEARELLPGGPGGPVDELPTWGEDDAPSPTPATPLDRVKEWLSGDPYTAVMVGVSSLLILFVLLFVFLRACS